jgi:hypothetical protein
MATLRFDRRYGLLAVAITLIELSIACFVLELPWRRAASIAFAIACAIELGQALRLVTRLGLEDNALARVVLGTFYDPRDLIAYAAALPLITLYERITRTRAASPARSPRTTPADCR